MNKLLISLSLSLAARAVDQIDEDAFRNTIETNNVFMAFVAPWCGHCQALKPVFEALEPALSDLGLVIATVDATENQELAASYKVQGYPTILYFSHGAHITYSGERTESAITDWIIRRQAPVVVSGSVDDAIAKSKDRLVIYSALSSDYLIEYFSQYAKLLAANDGPIFMQGPGEGDSLEIFANEKVLASQTVENGPEIMFFIQRESLPLFGEITSENFEKYEQLTGVSFVWVCLDSSDLKSQLETATPAIESLAKEFRKFFNFVWIDTVKFGPETQDQIGCSLESFPSLVVHQVGDKPSQMTRYRRILNGMDVESARNFLEGVVAGTEPSFYKSKELGSENNLPIPEISSDALLNLEGEALVIVSVGDLSICAECAAAINAAALIKALVDSKAPEAFGVYWIDGLENDPPAAAFGWENIPFVLYKKSDKTVESLPVAVTPDTIMNFVNLQNEQFRQLSANMFETPDAMKSFSESIKDTKIKAAVESLFASLSDEEDFDFEEETDPVKMSTEL